MLCMKLSCAWYCQAAVQMVGAVDLCSQLHVTSADNMTALRALLMAVANCTR